MNEKILELFLTLPPEAQQEALEYLKGLQQRSRAKEYRRRRGPLRSEPFISQWKQRADLSDSPAWVRQLRQDEWRR